MQQSSAAWYFYAQQAVKAVMHHVKPENKRVVEAFVQARPGSTPEGAPDPLRFGLRIRPNGSG